MSPAAALLVFALLLGAPLLFVVHHALRRVQAALPEALTDTVQACARHAPPPTAGPLRAEELAALPAPVAQYLRQALGASPSPAALLRLRQIGRLRRDGEATRWMPFHAEQIVAPAAQAFAWVAQVQAGPGVSLQVIDTLQAGRGAGQVRLWGWLPMARASEVPAMNLGSLHRFLAEAVWYPAALRPSEQLHWSAIDAHRALATLSVGALSVSLEFRFNPQGEVESIFTPGRWGRFDGGYDLRAWEGHFSDYREVQGQRVPHRGEVGWVEHGAWACVWQGELVEALAQTPE